MVADDGWGLLHYQWWIRLALMVDNSLTYTGWTGNERRKTYYSILRVYWTWKVLHLRRIDGYSWRRFILARLNGYMNVMLWRAAVDLSVFDQTRWAYHRLFFSLIDKAFPLDLALQLCIKITKAFRSVEHRYTLWVCSDEEIAFRPVASLLVSSAFNKLTILIRQCSNNCRVVWTLWLHRLWNKIDWLFDLRHKMHHIPRQGLYRRHW